MAPLQITVRPISKQPAMPVAYEPPGGGAQSPATEAEAHVDYPEELPGLDTGERPHLDDLEPAFRRHGEERTQLAAVGQLANSTGTDPDKLLSTLADRNALSGNATAENIVAHNRSYSELLAATGRGAKSAAADVARGVIELPRQVVGGARDAIDATAQLGKWIGENLLGAKESDFENDPALNLPEVKQPTTTTGGVVRSVSQFLTGFAGAGKFTAPVKMGTAVPAWSAAQSRTSPYSRPMRSG
jgi:hypothetical protein